MPIMVNIYYVSYFVLYYHNIRLCTLYRDNLYRITTNIIATQNMCMYIELKKLSLSRYSVLLSLENIDKKNIKI